MVAREAGAKYPSTAGTRNGAEERVIPLRCFRKSPESIEWRGVAGEFQKVTCAKSAEGIGKNGIRGSACWPEGGKASANELADR